LKTNFVLIDFENVQPKNMGSLKGGSFKIKVFLGTNQTKIPLEMALALQLFGPDAEYIQIDGNGNNALDFHIAYYIGQLAAVNPDAHFHIISKDKGFDPLIKHLHAKKISCQRSTSIADIPLAKISNVKPAPEKPVKTSNTKPAPEKIDTVIDNLAKRKASRPRTLKTLRSTIKALFVNQLADEELEELLEQLSKRGTIDIKDGKVSYGLPS
jgi:hypothetical protein